MLEWAYVRKVDPDLLSPTLYHYLYPTCPVCDGLGQLRMADAPVLGKQCHACKGRGSRVLALGAGRVLDWLKSCAGRAKAERGGAIGGKLVADDFQEMAGRRNRMGQDDEGDTRAIAEHFRRSMGAGRSVR